ncbi:MAG: hypothetical protein M1826_003928 [Phylliscum demangeonii]|nr:MAG: hypothetical protein M1826_003928 [Phylliscum demangeonii]
MSEGVFRPVLVWFEIEATQWLALVAAEREKRAVEAAAEAATAAQDYPPVLVGKSAFSRVYQVAAKRNGNVYAAKELSKRLFFKSHGTDRRLDSEMVIMTQLRHPHIVQYIEHLMEPEAMYIIMEYISGGNLGTMLSERDA